MLNKEISLLGFCQVDWHHAGTFISYFFFSLLNLWESFFRVSWVNPSLVRETLLGLECTHCVKSAKSLVSRPPSIIFGEFASQEIESCLKMMCCSSKLNGSFVGPQIVYKDDPSTSVSFLIH